MRAAFLVNGIATRGVRLKVTSASSAVGLRCAANARAAASASLIGLPAILSLASTTSTVANLPGAVAPADVTVRLATPPPFSATATVPGRIVVPVGTDRTYERDGKFAPPASVSRIRDRPSAAAAPDARTNAVTARTDPRARRLIGPAPRRDVEADSTARRTGSSAGSRHASRTRAGMTAGNLKAAGYPRR